MYLGRIVEEGPTEEIFARPRHPYTQGLVAAILHADLGARGRLSLVKRLAAGDLPSLLDPPQGCRYQSRCPYALDDPCRGLPPAEEIVEGRGVSGEGSEEDLKEESVSGDHRVACYRHREIAAGKISMEGVPTGEIGETGASRVSSSQGISQFAQPPERL